MSYELCWLKQEIYFTQATVIGTSDIIHSVRKELARGTENDLCFDTPTILLNRDQVSNENLPLSHVQHEQINHLKRDGYVIYQNNEQIQVIGSTDVAVLYGYYHLRRLILTGQNITSVLVEEPYNQIRMINHWDNMDPSDFMGSVERGYAGNSIFYEDLKIIKDKSRIQDYARLLASVGINGLTINNVNVHALESKLITPEFLPEVAELALIFRAYGIRFYLSINYASPIQLGGLTTSDPLDDEVNVWWAHTFQTIYSYIPDFGGVVVKADSEGRPGPYTYGRTHADGANMLAKHIAPYGGLVFWRCFVYNCQQDWRDRKTDRARAAYDHFKDLDGSFLDNVILQIKNGPIDFQVREPLSPLLGALKDTNIVMEFQVTQEYTGHSNDICYLVPQWKEYMEFDTFAKGEGSLIRDVACGSLHGRNIGGMTAVINVGDDANWTGHTLAQANFYGYGRLIWNPCLSAEEIAEEWIRLSLGMDQEVVDTTYDILLTSWTTYEDYTAPLSVGFMVTPSNHYGCNIDGYEYSRWGTYHFADRNGVGVDRTLATGTGYTGQYFHENCELYEHLESCPDELLLFFHHVPYTHVLHSGETLIQHIYNSHFEGVANVEAYVKAWERLQGKMEQEAWLNVRERLQKQLFNAKEWRDQINTYFFRKSGIADVHGREIFA